MGGHCYHDIGNFLAKVLLRAIFHLLQNHGGNLLRGEELAISRPYNGIAIIVSNDIIGNVEGLGSEFLELSSHKSFYACNGILGIRYQSGTQRSPSDRGVFFYRCQRNSICKC